uniref:Uncharacterized protein n=1 Tax=Rhipicephalus zambeziensis TaxID=60191 RepID=A0A224YGW6_9ACAR
MKASARKRFSKLGFAVHVHCNACLYLELYLNNISWSSWYDLVNMTSGHQNNRCREKQTDTKITTCVCALQQLKNLGYVHLSVQCNACMCEPHFTRGGTLSRRGHKTAHELL